jgi:dihydrolipoamide dehydrogenase
VKFPLGANARSVTLGGGSGFALLVFERTTNLVLGMHLLGPGVGELIGTGALAIELGARVDDLAHTIFPHPSVSEVIGELGELALGLPLHTPPPRR